MPIKRTDPKATALREQGVWYSHAARVTDALFLDHDFFDARDLLQVRYEMLRRVSADGVSVTDAARDFGVSRPTFYHLQSAFRAEGLAGLLPHKRGPQSGHKLTNEVIVFLERLLAEEATLRPATLAQRLVEQFNLEVHPRSIERALQREKKAG